MHVFTIENQYIIINFMFYEKYVSPYLYWYTYRFSFCFQNHVMEHNCEMNKSGFKVPELHPLPKGVSPGKLWEIYIKIAYPRWLVVWHYDGHPFSHLSLIDWLINLSRAGTVN